MHVSCHTVPLLFLCFLAVHLQLFQLFKVNSGDVPNGLRIDLFVKGIYEKFTVLLKAVYVNWKKSFSTKHELKQTKAR